MQPCRPSNKKSPPKLQVISSSSDRGRSPRRDLRIPRHRVPNVIPLPHDPEWCHIEAPRGYFTPKEKQFLAEVCELLAISASPSDAGPVFDAIYELWSYNHQLMMSEIKLEIID